MSYRVWLDKPVEAREVYRRSYLDIPDPYRPVEFRLVK